MCSCLKHHGSTPECVKYLLFVLENSPQTYAMNRDMLTGLRIAIVNAELRHREQMESEHVSSTANG